MISNYGIQMLKDELVALVFAEKRMPDLVGDTEYNKEITKLGHYCSKLETQEGKLPKPVKLTEDWEKEKENVVNKVATNYGL